MRASWSLACVEASSQCLGDLRLYSPDKLDVTQKVLAVRRDWILKQLAIKLAKKHHSLAPLDVRWTPLDAFVLLNVTLISRDQPQRSRSEDVLQHVALA